MKIIQFENVLWTEPETKKPTRKVPCPDVTIPRQVFKRAKLSGDIELEIMKNALVATSKEMTVLEIMGAIKSLEVKLEDYYRCLQDNFLADTENAVCDCEFCEDCLCGGESDSLEDLKEILELSEIDTKTITELSEEQMEMLHDLGLCLEEVNFSIMEDEIIYFGGDEG